MKKLKLEVKDFEWYKCYDEKDTRISYFSDVNFYTRNIIKRDQIWESLIYRWNESFGSEKNNFIVIFISVQFLIFIFF